MVTCHCNILFCFPGRAQSHSKIFLYMHTLVLVIVCLTEHCLSPLPRKIIEPSRKIGRGTLKLAHPESDSAIVMLPTTDDLEDIVSRSMFTIVCSCPHAPYLLERTNHIWQFIYSSEQCPIGTQPSDILQIGRVIYHARYDVQILLTPRQLTRKYFLTPNPSSGEAPCSPVTSPEYVWVVSTVNDGSPETRDLKTINRFYAFLPSADCGNNDSYLQCRSSNKILIPSSLPRGALTCKPTTHPNLYSNISFDFDFTKARTSSTFHQPVNVLWSLRSARKVQSLEHPIASEKIRNKTRNAFRLYVRPP